MDEPVLDETPDPLFCPHCGEEFCKEWMAELAAEMVGAPVFFAVPFTAEWGDAQ